MRLSKPSPAMVVAVTALVFAMTGTGIAAKSVLIDGAKIKNGSITGKKLAADAIVPKGVQLLAIRKGASSAAKGAALSAGASGSAHTSQALAPKSLALGAPCPGGGLTFTGPSGCPTPVATTPTASTAGPKGLDGLDAGTSLTSRAVFRSNPAAVVFSKFMSISGSGEVGLQPIDVAQVMAAKPQKARAVSVSLLGPWPARASSIVVSLLINDVNVSVTSLGCTITAAQPTCTAAGPADVPPSSRLAWSAQVIAPVVPPDIPTPVEDFALSVGFQTTAG